MIGNPPIILLDEPSTGLDPESRKFLWSVIHKITMNRKQSSVILTTHSMEEAESLCRRIGIMTEGQFKCLGTSQSIKETYGSGYEIPLRVSNLSDENLHRELQELNLKVEDVINYENLKQILSVKNKQYLLKYFTSQNNLGSELFNEVLSILHLIII